MNKVSALDIALRHYGTSTALSAVIGKTPQGVSYRVRKNVTPGLSAEEAFLVHQDSGIPLSVLRPDLWGAEAMKG